MNELTTIVLGVGMIIVGLVIVFLLFAEMARKSGAGDQVIGERDLRQSVSEQERAALKTSEFEPKNHPPPAPDAPGDLRRNI